MRGQATPIQQNRQKRIPKNTPTTIMPQDKRTEVRIQTYLLFTILAEQASVSFETMQTYFPQRQETDPSAINTKTFGGAERDRTADPLLAKQVLSQLS